MAFIFCGGFGQPSLALSVAGCLHVSHLCLTLCEGRVTVPALTFLSIASEGGKEAACFNPGLLQRKRVWAFIQRCRDFEKAIRHQHGCWIPDLTSGPVQPSGGKSLEVPHVRLHALSNSEIGAWRFTHPMCRSGLLKGMGVCSKLPCFLFSFFQCGQQHRKSIKKI